eukprot:1187184-Prorocentrum_minimum.AAC.6
MDARVGLDTDIKPLRCRLTTGEFNSPPNYLRTPHVRVEPYARGGGSSGSLGFRGRRTSLACTILPNPPLGFGFGARPPPWREIRRSGVQLAIERPLERLVLPVDSHLSGLEHLRHLRMTTPNM